MKILTLLTVASLQLIAAPIPQNGKDKHMGVATCSSGVCHGQSVENKGENVMMNEYRTWLQHDEHSGAYKLLLKPASKLMAKKLGLKSAHTAKICLDCHADNVPVEMRGKKFQLSDGIGCEACHGGSERWLSDHKEPGATHKKNIELGLYPSEKPPDRAKLCLSCHLGTAHKFATHTIMGAGHPRLDLELESFTQNQPAHYKVDADYEKRKGSIKSVNMWLTGLVYKANSQMNLLQSKQFTKHSLFPELSFYECHSCHRGMSPTRWPLEKASKSMPAGSVRLEDAPLVVLISVLKSVDQASSQKLFMALKQLHSSSLKSKDAIQKKAKNIQAILNEISTSLITKTLTKSQKQNMRKTLIIDASQNSFRDYSSALQVFYAIETISIDLGDSDKYSKHLDKIFDKISDENKFYPDQFQVIAKLFLKEL